MSEPAEGLELRAVSGGPDAIEEPNVRPGPTEEGGHGGMATREQEQRLVEEANTPGAAGSTEEPPD